MGQPTHPGPARRVLVPLAGGAAVLAVAGLLLHRFFTDPTFLPPHDFYQYWAAGRLLLTGGDPYDADALYAVQVAHGSYDPAAIVNWQPPWALGVSLPLGLLPVRTAQLAWLAVQAGLVAGCCAALWRVYGGPAGGAWVAVALGLVFPPTVYLVQEGQSGGWLLAGLTGWVLAFRRSPWWAGLLPLCALKPHLFGPLGVAAVLHAGRDRRTAGRLGLAVLVGLAVTAAVTLAEPAVWGQYAGALGRPPSARHRPLDSWRPPLVGYVLRAAVAPDRFWVQFVPAAAGCALAAGYYWRRRDRWDWVRETPGLVAAGAVAAPYSGWMFDLVVLLVPVTAAAARVAAVAAPRQAAWALAAAAPVYVAMLPLRPAPDGDGSGMVWVAPAVWAGCWAVGRAFGEGDR